MLSPNGIDFLEYWGAIQLFKNGENPYNANKLLAVQRIIEPLKTQPIMMWNPPHTLSLIFPIVNFSYKNALIFWRLAGLLIYLFLAWRAFKDSFLKSSLSFVAVIIGFSPFILSIHVGQIGLLLALGVFLLYEGLRKQSIFMLMCSIIILSIKPHIFILLGLTLSFSFYYNSDIGRLKTLLKAALFTALVLCIHAGIYLDTYLNWWAALSNPESTAGVVPHAINWIGHGFIPAFFYYIPVGIPVFQLSRLIFAVTALTTILLFVIIKPRLNTFNLFLPILILSISLSPLCWCTDFVAWSYPFFIWINESCEKLRKAGGVCISGLFFDSNYFLLLILTLNLTGYFFVLHFYDYWAMAFLFPAAVLVLWEAFHKELQAIESDI